MILAVAALFAYASLAQTPADVKASDTKALLAQARMLNQKAITLYGLGKYRDAEQLFRETLTIIQQARGDEHLDVANCLGNIARSLSSQGRYAEAEALGRVSLALMQKLRGEEHLDTASSLGNLALDLSRQGKILESEKLNRQALALREKHLGPEHPDVAASLNNLALDLFDQGLYAQSETMHRQALAIRRKWLKADHLDISGSQLNLAMTLFYQGRFTEAERLDRAALESRQKTLGEEHISVALVRHNLARDLYQQERFAEAEELDRMVLKVRIQVLGEEHPLTLSTRHNLAGDLFRLGKYEEAEALNRQVLAARRRLFDRDHPEIAVSLTNLAVDLLLQGKAEEAEQLDRQALAICRRRFGETHPLTASSLANLARDLMAQSRDADAEPILEKAALAFSSARTQVAFAGLDRAHFSGVRSPYLWLAHVKARRNRPREAWDALEQDLARGLFDDLAAETSRPLAPEDRQAEQSLRAKLAQTERQILQTSDSKLLIALHEQRDDLLLAWTRLEDRLNRKYGTLSGSVYGLEKIQKHLQPHQAMAAFVDLPGAAGGSWAVVVRKQGEPHWIGLRNVDPALSDALRRELQHPSGVVDVGPLCKKLARQRLDPLRPTLDGVRHLLMLPSRALAGLPMEAWASGMQMSYVPSGTVHAWLSERASAPKLGPDHLLALGDPQFGNISGPMLPRGSNTRGLGPIPLPCTRSEVDAIAKLVRVRGGQAETLLGAQASLVGLDGVRERAGFERFRFLHLATHGHPNAEAGLHSFLALAPQHPDRTGEDRLTAAEILRTWKLNADLVTLSACSSGLGQYQGGDGYVGFAQALFLAGARSLVLSQWQVSDHATSLFMVRFYQNLLGQRDGLAEPMGKLKALDEARSWLKTLKHDDAARLVERLPGGAREVSRWDGEETPYSHPSYWAAFILVGQP